MEIIIILLLAGGIFLFLKKNPQIAANLTRGISETINNFSAPSGFSSASNPAGASSQHEPASTPRTDGQSAGTGGTIERPYAAESSTDEVDHALVPRETPSTLPVPTIPASRPPKGMHLKLRRAQRAGVMGRVIFALDVRIEPSSEQLALIRKYGLGKMIVYDSEARKQHTTAAEAHMDAAADAGAGAPFTGAGAAKALGSTLWRTAKGAARAAAAAFSLRCTIESLIAGQHIECKDLNELLGAEQAIKEACETTRAFLDVAITFDGREEVIEY